MIVAFVDVITYTLYFFIGTDRPELKYLYRYVRPLIYTHWLEIGIELLGEVNILNLSVIRENNRDDGQICAVKMLHLWLQSSEDASWNELIQVLRQPHMGLSVLASKIENMLVKEEDISFKGMITIMCNALNFMKISAK